MPDNGVGMAQMPVQRGVALFACLALLLLLTIAATSAVRTTMLETRMVRNAEDALLAFQAAEAALREGEAHVSDGIGDAGVFTDAGLAGLWTVAPLGQAERWSLAEIWAVGSRRSRVAETRLESVAWQPRYIVEWLATLESTTEPPPSEGSIDEEPAETTRERIEVFRITAHGVGRTEAAHAMVQSTYGILIRDEGECSGVYPETPHAPNRDGMSVFYSGDADCRSSLVKTPASDADVGRLSWREIALP